MRPASPSGRSRATVMGPSPPPPRHHAPLSAATGHRSASLPIVTRRPPPPARGRPPREGLPCLAARWEIALGSRRRGPTSAPLTASAAPVRLANVEGIRPRNEAEITSVLTYHPAQGVSYVISESHL